MSLSVGALDEKTVDVGKSQTQKKEKKFRAYVAVSKGSDVDSLL